MDQLAAQVERLATAAMPALNSAMKKVLRTMQGISHHAKGLDVFSQTLINLGQQALPQLASATQSMGSSFTDANQKMQAASPDCQLLQAEDCPYTNKTTSYYENTESLGKSPAEEINKSSKAAEKGQSIFQKLGEKIKDAFFISPIINTFQQAMQTLGSMVRTGITNMESSWAPLGDAMSSAKKRLVELANAFGSLLAPMLLAVLPIFDQIISAVITAVNAIGMFFAKLMGRKTYTRLVKSGSGATKGTFGIGSAAKEAAKDVKELDRAVNTLGIDELNVLQLPEESSSGGGSGSGESGGGSSGSGDADGGFVTEEVPLEDTASALAKFWDDFSAKLQPSVDAWSAAWQQIQNTAVAVWPKIQSAASELWEKGLAPLNDFLVTEFAPSISNAFSMAFAPIVGGTISTGLQVFADFFTFICGLLTDIILSTVIPLLQLLQTIWKDLMEGIQITWMEYGQPIMDNVTLAFQNIWNILMALWETVLKPLFQDLLEKINVLWNDHLKPLWDNVVGLIADIILCLLVFWNNVLSPIIEWLISTFGPVFKSVFKGVGGVVFSVVGLISDYINAIVTVFRGLIHFLTAIFQGDWDEAWKSIDYLFSQSWDDMYRNMDKSTTDIRQSLNSLIKDMEESMNEMIDKINSLFSSIRSFAKSKVHIDLNLPTLNHISLPTIPERSSTPERPLIPERSTVPWFAKGAVLTQRTLFEGGEYPGAQTNPEIVSPLSMMKGAFRQALAEQGGMGGSFTAEQPIELSLDGDVFYRAMVKIKQNRGVTIGSAFAEAY